MIPCDRGGLQTLALRASVSCRLRAGPAGFSAVQILQAAVVVVSCACLRNREAGRGRLAGGSRGEAMILDDGEVRCGPDLHRYHARFLLTDGRVAEVLLPKDITVKEAEMIASIVWLAGKRSAGLDHWLSDSTSSVGGQEKCLPMQVAVSKEKTNQRRESVCCQCRCSR